MKKISRQCYISYPHPDHNLDLWIHHRKTYFCLLLQNMDGLAPNFMNVVYTWKRHKCDMILFLDPLVHRKAVIGIVADVSSFNFTPCARLTKSHTFNIEH